MEGVHTKAQSQGQDSQITSQNVEGFQKRVKEIVNLVTQLSGMYGALAEEREHSKKEVKKEEKKVLLEKISTLEKEVLSSKKKIQDLTDENNKISTLEKQVLGSQKRIQELTDENATLKAEKADVAALNTVISKANRKIETMEKVIEGSRKQLTTRDEESKKKHQELAHKVFNLNQKIRTLERQVDEIDAKRVELYDEVALGLAEIAYKDEEIWELNSQINLLKLSYAAEQGSLNAEIEKLKAELREKCALLEELNLKHDALMAFYKG